MTRYKQLQDGEWTTPIMRGYRMKCCGCGLVHRVNFKVSHHGRGHTVKFQAFRAPTQKPKQ